MDVACNLIGLAAHHAAVHQVPDQQHRANGCADDHSCYQACREWCSSSRPGTGKGCQPGCCQYRSTPLRTM